MSSTNRTGVWEVGPTHAAFALMAAVELDLRGRGSPAARPGSTPTPSGARSNIYVNAHTNVIVDGVGIMGAFVQARDKVEANVGPTPRPCGSTGALMPA